MVEKKPPIKEQLASPRKVKVPIDENWLLFGRRPLFIT